MANANKYDIKLRTESTDAVPAALVGTKYWYDTGLVEHGEPVLYDNSTGSYAYWTNGAAWFITAASDVGNELASERFVGTETSLSGDLPVWTGTITASATVIADAWYRAETEAFNSLATYTGCEEGKDCYRGFLPVVGDSDDFDLVNVWQMTSGGADFDIERTFGNNALWCSLQNNVRIESLWETREKALKFAGIVTAWIKETNNLAQSGNVTWCTLAELPDEPEIYRTDGENRQRLWQQTINLELTYKTETTYE